MVLPFEGDGRELFFREEAVELGIYLFRDALEVGNAGLELQRIAIDNEQLPGIVLNPCLVALVQTREVVDADALLVLSATLGDLGNEVRDGTAYVDEQVGQTDERHHQVEEVAVVLEVAVAHVALGVEVRGEDAGVLEDSTVLDDGVATLGYLDHVAEALVKEIDLEVEAPAVHVLIEVLQVGVHVNWLEARRPAVTLDEQLGQGGLAAPDVSCYRYMHILRIKD